MTTTTRSEKYPPGIRILHWLMALVILGLIVLGYYMTPFDMDNPALSENLYYWHKSFGFLVLLLIFVRFGVRRAANIPELPAGMSAFDTTMARISHVLLYVLMFLVPFSGYVDSSAYPHSSGVHFFFIDIPDLVDKNEALSGVANLLHKIFAYTMLVVIVLHVIGALKHRFIDVENNVLNRIV